MHRTEIERQFLAAKGFNTNLVQFLPRYCVIISNVYIIHVYFFTCMISHVHGCAHKTILDAQNLMHEKLLFMRAWMWEIRCNLHKC